MTVDELLALTPADMEAMTREERIAALIVAFEALPADLQEEMIAEVKRMAAAKGATV